MNYVYTRICVCWVGNTDTLLILRFNDDPVISKEDLRVKRKALALNMG